MSKHSHAPSSFTYCIDSHNQLDSGQPSIVVILLRWFLGGRAVWIGQHTRATIPLRPPAPATERERGTPISSATPKRWTISLFISKCVPIALVKTTVDKQPFLGRRSCLLELCRREWGQVGIVGRGEQYRFGCYPDSLCDIRTARPSFGRSNQRWKRIGSILDSEWQSFSRSIQRHSRLRRAAVIVGRRRQPRMPDEEDDVPDNNDSRRPRGRGGRHAQG
ncbi:hypothetical protein V8E53_007503 [Lactarius tabidus]